MPERRLKGALRRAIGATDVPRPSAGHRDRLEATVLGAYRNRYPLHRRWLMMLNPWNRAARLAMAGLAVALLGVGACSTSTTTEVEMGQKLTIGLTAKADADFPAIEADLNRVLSTHAEVEGVNFNLRGVDGRTTVLEIMVWGQDVDAAKLEAELRKQVPVLADASVKVEPLNGSVRESLLSHFGHEVLGLEMEVNGETADEIRQQILAQMSAAGVSGDAQVQVETTPDGRKLIRVEVTGEPTP